MEFANLTTISAHKSVRALNSSVESLSEDTTSTVKFLYNSVRKFFVKVFPAKNSTSAAREEEKIRPFDFIRKNFAKSSFRFNFLPIIPGGVSPSCTKKWPSMCEWLAVYIVKHGKRIEKFYRALGISKWKQTVPICLKIIFNFVYFIRRQGV